MQDLIEKLQTKVKSYKRQAVEAVSPFFIKKNALIDQKHWFLQPLCSFSSE